MKKFAEVLFDVRQCKRELDEFHDLLGQETLQERAQIKPFFEKRPQLSAFIGTYIPDVQTSTSLLAFEWDIRGDFTADIVVGNKKNLTYCMVELEDGRSDSIFTSSGKKHTKEWNRRFEHGFSQLVDWFFALDDLRLTKDFADDFGHGHVKFHGLLIVGRSAGISQADRSRLRWREEHVLIASHPVYCVTYDELHEKLTRRLAMYSAAATTDAP